MTMQKKPKTSEVKKPFLTGAPTDERTAVNGLKFFGTVLLVFFISLVISLTAAFNNPILKITVNSAIILLVLVIFFNNGSKKGAEDVAKGEILWQRKETGKEFSESERKLCFHPLKGFTTGLIGMIPFVIIAILLAVTTRISTTDSGTLPSWMQAYVSRSDIGDALVNYTNPEGLHMVDVVRAAVRLCILPFVNIIGSANRNGLLLIERLSPLIMLLPACAYGTGYLTGRNIRTQVHTAISENERKRKKKEIRRRNAAKKQIQHREPEKLN